MAVKLIHYTFARNEAHCVGRMLDSVLRFVSESYIIVDDRTTDETVKIIEEHGGHYKYFKFFNFGKTQNTVLEWLSGKSDWVFGLAPDELILSDFGAAMVELVEQIHDSDIDGVYYSRMHWLDLEMMQKKEWNYPDWQQRLIRNDYPRIHAVGYVHAPFVGIKKSVYINNNIQHFNLYWKERMEYDWHKVHDLYKSLQIDYEQEKGANIWP